MSFLSHLPLILSFVLSAHLLCAQEIDWTNEETENEGFSTQNIGEEELEYEPYVVELTVIPSRPLEEEINITEAVFDHKLSNEFKSRYKQIFGDSAISLGDGVTEQVDFRNPSPHNFHNAFGFSGAFRGDEVALRREQNRFGSYMMRKIAEHHVDKYARKETFVRQVYEFQEKYTQLNIQVAKKFKMKTKYNLSTNILSLKAQTPWFDNSLVVEMDSSKIGPADIRRATLTLDAEGFYNFNYNASYQLLNKNLTLALGRQWTQSFSSSFSISIDNTLEPLFVENVPGLEIEDQALQTTDTRFLASFSWSY